MVMIIEILLVLLLIVLVFLFIIFLKSWHIHIIFKNEDLDYSFNVKINILFVNLLFFTVEKSVYLKVQFTLFSKTLDIFELNFNEDKTEETNEEISTDDENDIFENIKQAVPLLIDAKGELYSIIKLLVKMVKFDESYVFLDIGLLDNNLTINLCTLLWTLTAPLYPLNFKLYLTPEINKLLVKSDVNIKFDIILLNLIRILLFILKRKKLRNIVKVLI
jgi:hypothetical protein